MYGPQSHQQSGGPRLQQNRGHPGRLSISYAPHQGAAFFTSPVGFSPVQGYMMPSPLQMPAGPPGFVPLQQGNPGLGMAMGGAPGGRQGPGGFVVPPPPPPPMGGAFPHAHMMSGIGGHTRYDSVAFPLPPYGTGYAMPQQGGYSPVAPHFRRPGGGHGSTPSTATSSVRSHNKRPTLSLKPPSSAGISRASSPGGHLVSPSVSVMSTATGTRKRKNPPVRLPLERVSPDAEEAQEEGGELEGGPKKRRKSLWCREPLSELKRCEREQLFEGDVRVAPLGGTRSRDVHFDEEPVLGLPPAIDIYLPAQWEWEDIKAAMLKEGVPLGFPGLQHQGPPAVSPQRHLPTKSLSATAAPFSFPARPPLPAATLGSSPSQPPFLPPTAAQHQPNASQESITRSQARQNVFQNLMPWLKNVVNASSPEREREREMQREADEPASETGGRLRPSRSMTLFARLSGLPLQTSPPQQQPNMVDAHSLPKQREAPRVLPRQPKRNSSGDTAGTGVATDSDDFSAGAETGGRGHDADNEEDVITNSSEESSDSESVELESSAAGAREGALGPAIVLAGSTPSLRKASLASRPSEQEQEQELEWSNPSDEERARDQDRHRLLLRGRDGMDVGGPGDLEIESPEQERGGDLLITRLEPVTGDVAAGGPRRHSIQPPNPDDWLEGRGEPLSSSPEVHKQEGEEEDCSVHSLGSRLPSSVEDPENMALTPEVSPTAATRHTNKEHEVTPDFKFPARALSYNEHLEQRGRQLEGLFGSKQPHGRTGSLLNAKADEFVFGAPAGHRPLPVPPASAGLPARPLPIPPPNHQARHLQPSVDSLGSAGFGLGIGAPGSLTAASAETSPAKNGFAGTRHQLDETDVEDQDLTLELTAAEKKARLNPAAAEFTPGAFTFSPPSGAPKLPSLDLDQKQSSFLGTKRLKFGVGELDDHIEALGHEKHARGTLDPDQVVSINDFPSPPAPPSSQDVFGATPLRNNIYAPVKASPHISPNPASARRLPIPDFGSAPVESNFKPPPTSPSRHRGRAESVDDIALPSNSRPSSKAIAIGQRRIMPLPGDSVGQQAANGYHGNDNSGEMFVMDDFVSEPPTPSRANSVTSASDASSDEDLTAEGTEGDDREPLQILEDLLERHFEEFKAQLDEIAQLRGQEREEGVPYNWEQLVARIEDAIRHQPTARSPSNGVDALALDQIRRTVIESHADSREELREQLRELAEELGDKLQRAPTSGSITGDVLDSLEHHLRQAPKWDGVNETLKELKEEVREAGRTLANSIEPMLREVAKEGVTQQTVLDTSVRSFEQSLTRVNERLATLSSKTAHLEEQSTSVHLAISDIKPAVDVEAISAAIVAALEPSLAALKGTTDSSSASDVFTAVNSSLSAALEPVVKGMASSTGEVKDLVAGVLARLETMEASSKVEGAPAPAIDALTKQLEASASLLQEQKLAHQAEVLRLSTELQSLRDTNAQLVAERDQKSQKVDELNVKLATAAQRDLQQSSRVAKLMLLEEGLKESRIDVQSLREKLEMATILNARSTERREQDAEMIESLRNTARMLEGKLEDQSSKVENLVASNAAREQRYQELSMTLNSQATSHSVALSDANAVELSLRTQLQDYRTRFDDMEREVLAMRDDLGGQLIASKREAQALRDTLAASSSAVAAGGAGLPPRPNGLATPSSMPRPLSALSGNVPLQHQPRLKKHVSAPSYVDVGMLPLRRPSSSSPQEANDDDDEEEAKTPTFVTEAAAAAAAARFNSKSEPPPATKSDAVTRPFEVYRDHDEGSDDDDEEEQEQDMDLTDVPSPTPSRLGREVVLNADGWWS